MSIWMGDAIQPSHPLLASSPPAFNLYEHQGLLQWVSSFCIRWPKYWSFSISLSNEYSGLISFQIYWFDLLAVQGTLKSLLQHYRSKALVTKNMGWGVFQIGEECMCWPWISRAGITCHWINTNEQDDKINFLSLSSQEMLTDLWSSWHSGKVRSRFFNQ